MPSIKWGCVTSEIGAVDRDQTELINARREFEKLVARFSQSKFSILAEKRSGNARRRWPSMSFT